MANTIPSKLKGIYLKAIDDNTYKEGYWMFDDNWFNDYNFDYNYTTLGPVRKKKNPLELNKHPLIVFLDIILMKFMSFIDYLDKKE